jgi:hypothetical protein
VGRISVFPPAAEIRFEGERIRPKCVCVCVCVGGGMDCGSEGGRFLSRVASYRAAFSYRARNTGSI